MFSLKGKKEAQLGTRLYTALGSELALKRDASTPARLGKAACRLF